MTDPSQLANICWDYMSERPDIKVKLALYAELIGFQGREFEDFVGELGKRCFVLGVSSQENPKLAEQNFIDRLHEIQIAQQPTFGVMRGIEE